MKFDRDKIDGIKESVDIVDIISRYVDLKKRGREFLGLCPFHVEKTPSFTVVPQKGFFHCFGCGQNGDVIDFIMEHEAVNFSEALEHLAGLVGISLDRSEDEELEYFAMKINEFAMFKYAENSTMVKEFFSERHLPYELCDIFHVGYVTPDSSVVLRKYSKHIKTITGLGLVYGRDGVYKERFANRLIFPIIHNKYPIGFGGRWVGTGRAKYINSKESALYNKSKALFGLAQAKRSIRKDGFVYLVEGYTDVLAFWAAGVKNVVACCGTAFTLNQARILSRMAGSIHIVYDPDSAGMRAGYKAVLESLKFGLIPYVVNLGKEDPNDFLITNGEKLLAEKVRTGKIFYEYYGKILEGKPLQRKIKLINDLKGSTRLILDDVTRGVLEGEVSRFFKVKYSTGFIKNSGTDGRYMPTLDAQILAGMMDDRFAGLLFRVISIDDIVEKKDLFSFLFEQHKSGKKVFVRDLMGRFPDYHEYISNALFPSPNFDRQSLLRLAREVRKRTVDRELENVDIEDRRFETLRELKMVLEQIDESPQW